MIYIVSTIKLFDYGMINPGVLGPQLGCLVNCRVPSNHCSWHVLLQYEVMLHPCGWNVVKDLCLSETFTFRRKTDSFNLNIKQYWRGLQTTETNR